MTADPMPVVGKARWEHFPHDTDIGIRGFGTTAAQAFEQAALALTAMITEAPIASLVTVEVRWEAQDLELLLVSWLDAVIDETAVRSMIFGAFAAEIDDLRERVSRPCRVAVAIGGLTHRAWSGSHSIRTAPRISGSGASSRRIRAAAARSGN